MCLKPLTHPGKPCSFLTPWPAQLPDLKHRERKKQKQQSASVASHLSSFLPSTCSLPVLFTSSQTSAISLQHKQIRASKILDIKRENGRDEQLSTAFFLSCLLLFLDFLFSKSQTCKQQPLPHKDPIKCSS